MANGIVLGGKLKFRKKASTSGTVITSIPTGTVLSVSAVSGNDSWYQTTYSTYGTGYVMIRHGGSECNERQCSQFC